MRQLLKWSFPCLVFLLVLFISIGLYSFRTRIVTGTVARSNELQFNRDALELYETLPTEATNITYWISPYNQYYEASFQISKKTYIQWLRRELAKDTSADHRVNKLDSRILNEVDFDVVTNDVKFPLVSAQSYFVHINRGIFFDRLSTHRYEEFSTVFDINQNRAYLYFYK